MTTRYFPALFLQENAPAIVYRLVHSFNCFLHDRFGKFSLALIGYWLESRNALAIRLHFKKQNAHNL